MRLFKTLLHSCLKDFRKNIKQFIAIVFIIGIAVTLFTGLSSNSIEFQKRVETVYSSNNGNLADIWLTVDQTYDENEAQNDLDNIKKLAGKNGKVETRTLIPSSVCDISSYALISIDRPTINKEYDAKYDYSGNDLTKDFFFIDEQIVSKYESTNNLTFQLGSEYPVTFSSSTLSSIKEIFIGDYDEITEEIEEAINNSDELTFSQKVQIISFIENNKEDIKTIIEESFNKVFDKENITLNIKVNGKMKHPENIQNGTFTDCNYILSARTLINAILDKLGDNLNYDDLYNYVNESSLPDSIKKEILNYLEDKKLTFNSLVSTFVDEAKDSVMNEDNNEYVERFKTIRNQYIIQVDSSYSVKDVMSNIKEYYSNTYPDETKIMAIMDAENYPSNAVVQNDIIQSRNLAYCFPIIFFVVAVLVVLTTITQMMLKQRIQIGTMKAIGVSNRSILLYYLCYMNFIGIVGTLVGLIVGPLLIPRVMNIKYGLLYSLPTIGYSFPWIEGIASLLVVIILFSLITYLIIRKELSLQPTESMRAKSPTIKLKEKKSSKKSDVKHVSMMMALRNIRVHISRSLMVIIGVMGCTGLLISGFGIEDTINYGKDLDLSSYLDCDYSITYNSGTKKDVVKEELLKIDGVKEVDEYSKLQTTLSCGEKNVDMSIFYFSYKSQFFKYDDEFIDGHWDLNGVGLSKAKATELNCKEGDTVSFTYNSKKYDMVVSKIFYTFSNSSVFIYQETLPDLTTSVSYAWLNINKDSKVSVSQIENNISKTNGVSSYLSREGNIKRIDNYMTSIKSMTNTIKVFALLLAVVVLINLAILNFEERSRDIATLRVLGFSRFEIAKSLIYEVMILTTIGALLGLTLGYPLEILVLSTNITPLISYSYTIFWYTFLISFAVSVVTAFVVNVAISYKVNKINMAESLKSIE